MHQGEYIKNVLEKYAMYECNSVCTPQEPGSPENDFQNPKFPFRELLGSLMFLSTVTRLDIAFSVNFYSRFMEKSLNSHCQALKRILRYLKGTIDFGILYKRLAMTD